MDLTGADLSGVDLKDASLEGARLEGVVGLAAWQLRGANLTGAHLPEAIKKFEGLKTVESNTKSSARAWTSTIVGCLYCWLTIGTTTDAEFFGAEHATALPFLQTKISPYGFYAVAPLLLVVMFLYLQYSLQQLWEAFAALPAVFPDGAPLHKRAAPFFLSGIVQTQSRRFRSEATGLVRWQAFLAWLLGWWVVPITIALLWLRSLVARLVWLTAIQLVSLTVVITTSLFFTSVAQRTLRGLPPNRFCWRRLFESGRLLRRIVWALPMSAYLWWFSSLAFQDALPDSFRSHFRADLSYAKLSPSELGNATREGDEPRTNGLEGRNLKGCQASYSVMANINLEDADLSGCVFSGADLQNARIFLAQLSKTNLSGANLRGATLDISDAGSLQFADIQGASLYGRHVLYAEQSVNWVLARWGRSDAPKAGLPEDHEERINRKDLSGYNFSKIGSSLMWRADLKGWILRQTVFRGVQLDGADMSHADLRDACFNDARVTNVNFEGADLRGADLSKAEGLTQWQLNAAITDTTTKSPPGLHVAAGR